jgi:hypothetical protein
MRFFVLPGAAAKVPELVRRLGWSPVSLDLAVQWARRPTPANRWLPDVEELISAVAYACGRTR